MKASLRRIRQSLAIGPDSDVTDADLLRRFVESRDEAAFRSLVERHAALVWTVCRRVLRHTHDAEDAFQASFLTLSRKANSVRESGSLAAWLHRVAYRTALRAVASRKRIPTPDSNVPEPTTFDAGCPDETARLIDEEIERLPDVCRLPAVLHFVRGRTYDEIARELAWPLGTVSTRLRKARELLRERLSRRGIVPSILVLAAPTDGVAECAVRYAFDARAVPRTITLLSNGVIRTMMLKKAVPTLAFLLVAVVGVGAWTSTTASQPSEEPKSVDRTEADPDPTPTPKAADDDRLEEFRRQERRWSEERIALRVELAHHELEIHELERRRELERQIYIDERRALNDKRIPLELERIQNEAARRLLAKSPEPAVRLPVQPGYLLQEVSKRLEQLDTEESQREAEYLARRKHARRAFIEIEERFRELEREQDLNRGLLMRRLQRGGSDD